MPDPVRVAEFKARLATLPGKKVGICWRSMMLAAKRAKYFSPIDAWGESAADARASPSSILQYGDSAADIARAKEKFGVTIHQMEGLDLKDDIDGTAALCQALDLVLSAPTAAAHTACQRRRAEVWYPVGRPGLAADWERPNIPGMPTRRSSGRKSSAIGTR